MHEGFSIWELQDSVSELKDLMMIKKNLEYKEHQSLAYGIDWSWQKDNFNKNKDYIGTCSFYDNLFSIWNYHNINKH